MVTITTEKPRATDTSAGTGTSTDAVGRSRGATEPHWETQLFSGRSSSTARGWEAPTYAGIDDQLADARGRLRRISVRAAYQEVLYGRALLVDIRPAAQRAAEGEVAAHLSPLVVERNVLEWRFDPVMRPDSHRRGGRRGCWSCARRATPRRWPPTHSCA